MSVLSILKERGFIEDLTHTEELEAYLSNNRATCYIGFDPTASSLHVGSLVCIMALAHMQRDGHRPIALVGGGTGLIGDPSGKTELRKIITQDEIDVNKNGIRSQLSRFLDLFTFLPMDDIHRMKQLQGADVNKAKVVLAFEATKICHGEEEALKALKASASVFGAVEIPDHILPASSIPRGIYASVGEDSVPSSAYNPSEIVGHLSMVDLFMAVKLCASKSDARRLIQQGGAYINGSRISNLDQRVTEKDVSNDEILLRAGKKKYHRIILAKK